MTLAQFFQVPAGVPASEQRWREPPPALRRSGRSARMMIARWTQDGGSPEASPQAARSDCHVLEVSLRPTDVALTVDGTAVHDGRLPAGSLLLTRPDACVTALYRSACDLLHLFVPVSRFDALLREAGISEDSARFGPAAPDSIVSRLAFALLGADELEGAGADLYADNLAHAIVMRVLGRIPGTATGRHRRAGLLKWRQRRVAAYVEANLAEPIRLRDLASAAGLSRMHFAAQFRIATGLRPHDYVLRRRIEHAQDLLRDPAIPLAQVALGVGFQTQAHFTTVFRDQVRETPGRWRQLNRTA